MSADPAAEDEDARPGIQSVEIGAEILRALIAAGRPVALKDLARLAGMSAGKAHRYLVSLTRSELVRQDPATGHYGVGPMAIALGLAGLRGLDVVRLAAAVLPDLRDEVGETTLLALWSAHGPVVIDLEESSRPVYMNIRVGSLLPLLTTATGLLFAAYLPAGVTAPLLQAERTARSLAPAAVERRLAATRGTGLAAVEGDLVSGVAALAAPIFDHKGRIAAVIGLLGRVEELDVGFDGHTAARLRRTAAEISRRLGHDPGAAAV